MNIKTLLLSFILTLSLNDGLANVCESKNASPYLMFSTKTSYFEVFNGSTATDEYGKIHFVFNPEILLKTSDFRSSGLPKDLGLDARSSWLEISGIR